MRLLTTFTLLTICLTAIGQTFQTKRNNGYQVDTLFTKKDKRQKPLTFYPGTYIDTEYMYSDSTGIVVIVQNSLPKGGVSTDSTGKKFGYRIFFYRVINETSTPLELTVNFPSDSFAISHLSESEYTKFFLPQDTMTLNKEIQYSYGLKGLDSSSFTSFNKPTVLQRIINPKEESSFYIGVLLYRISPQKPKDGSREGAVRAELVLKEQDLFYRLNLLDALIPCGQIVFKK